MHCAVRQREIARVGEDGGVMDGNDVLAMQNGPRPTEAEEKPAARVHGEFQLVPEVTAKNPNGARGDVIEFRRYGVAWS